MLLSIGFMSLQLTKRWWWLCQLVALTLGVFASSGHWQLLPLVLTVLGINLLNQTQRLPQTVSRAVNHLIAGLSQLLLLYSLIYHIDRFSLLTVLVINSGLIVSSFIARPWPRVTATAIVTGGLAAAGSSLNLFPWLAAIAFTLVSCGGHLSLKKTWGAPLIGCVTALIWLLSITHG